MQFANRARTCEMRCRVSDPSKAFDPVAQLAELHALWGQWNPMMNPLRFMGSTPRYEAIDPTVAEIAVLAAMHNMASTLSNPGSLKAAISGEIAERAKRLAAS
jgi:hypothetical protein